MTGSEIPRIVLLGKTASDTSSAGNIILGLERFKSAESCEKHEAHVNGKSLKIINTPGLIDATEEKMKKGIEKLVFMFAPGPHVFLLVIRVDMRSTDEEKNTKKWIQENIGKDAVDHTIILFTHTDRLGNESIDQYIKERKDLHSLVSSCGRRFLLFDHQDQATELLENIQNMAERNQWKFYTNEMFEEIVKNVKWREKRDKVLGDAAKAASGVGAVVAGGVVLGATEMVLLPVLMIAGGVMIVSAVAKNLGENL